MRDKHAEKAASWEHSDRLLVDGRKIAGWKFRESNTRVLVRGGDLKMLLIVVYIFMN